MTVAVVTGSAGLIGSEAAVALAREGYHVVGIDNDMRAVYFGAEASTRWNLERVRRLLGKSYEHHSHDVRDAEAVNALFRRFGKDIGAVVHTAAQPSHDWAAAEPQTDFGVNALGTLNLLEATRLHAHDAVFVFTSTNKVYGDNPNLLPMVELPTRWEIEHTHRYSGGIAEDMSLDHTTHSLFGVSKVAADLLVQEYGRYFGMYTGSFRGGCLTGPNHSGTMLHGFLAYLMRCVATGRKYNVFGYGGKQVRDNIHSADFVAALLEFLRAPRVGEVYNMGGGRSSNCSMLEAIALAEQIAERELSWQYRDQGRVGDHMWYVSDTTKFEAHYPQWKVTRDVPSILSEMYAANHDRWLRGAS